MKKLLLLVAVILLAHSCSAEANYYYIKHHYERQKFQQHNHCPSTGKSSGPCPGFVIDLGLPVRCGGKDVESNMIWVTESVAKERSKKPCEKKR